MINIGALSYALGSLALLGLLAQLLLSWRGQLDRFLLTLAVLITAAWTGIAVYLSLEQRYDSAIQRLLDILHGLAWIAFSVKVLAGAYHRPTRAIVENKPIVYVIVAGALVYLLSIVAALPGVAADPPNDARATLLYHASGVLFSLAIMLLAERILRQTIPEKRGHLSMLFLTIGCLEIYDFVLHSLILIGQDATALWQARGLVIAFAVPFIMAAARNPGWSRDVYVSHSAAFTFAILVAAISFLMISAFGSLLVRRYGSEWGQVVQFVFTFMVIFSALLLLTSERRRGQLKVFLNKHFYNYKYDYREEWLRFIRTLSKGGPGAHLLETVIQALGQIVSSQKGILWLRADTGHFDLAAQVNIEINANHREPPRSSLIQFLEKWQWIINIDEYEEDPDLYQDLTLPAWLDEYPDAWLIVPLMQDVELLGFVVLSRPVAPRKINWEDHDLLKTAGRQAATHLAQLMTVQALVEAREFQAFSRLSAFVIHDLKNLIAQLSLVVSNAAKHMHNPDFMQDAINTVQHSVAKMNRLLAQLRKGHIKTGKAARINVAAIVREVVHKCREIEPRPEIEKIDRNIFIEADQDRFGAIVEHLIQNAQEATFDEGWVKVRVYQEQQHCIVEIEDNGCGMDGKFIRERLFRPFDTTKGQGGMGIGVYESRDYARELGGDIEVRSEPGVGSTFRVVVPIARSASSPGRL